MYDVKGQSFAEKRDAESYARIASQMYADSDFPVKTSDGSTVATYRQGRRQTAPRPAPSAGTDAIIRDIAMIRKWIGPMQMRCITDAIGGEEREWFIEKIQSLARLVESMPRPYATRDDDDPIAHLHYFRGSQDWYIVERDSSAVQHQAFGLADFGHCRELGYTSIVEITRLGVELDLHFAPRPLSKCGREVAV